MKAVTACAMRRRAAGILCTLLGSALAGAAVDSADMPERAIAHKQLVLIDKLEKIEAEQGAISDAAIPHLLDLSLLYIDEDHCGDAIMMLTRAVRLSRMNHGLFNPRQMELTGPLLECYLTLDLYADFQREQRYTLLIADHSFGRENPEILPALTHTALWYEEAGWYVSARKLYQRAVEIAAKAGGDNLNMIDPLRGIARTFRLEHAHGRNPVDMAENDIPVLSSHQRRGNLWMLDRLGEESLQRAIQILRARPEAGRTQLIDTLMDLGDWYQVGYVWRNALRTYKEALQEAGTENPLLFDEPVPVIYRADDIGVPLRKPLKNPERYDRYGINFEFTVNDKGGVMGLRVLESDVPEPYRLRVAEGFKQTRYRPRFVGGQPVDTEHVRFRQMLYLKK